MSRMCENNVGETERRLQDMVVENLGINSNYNILRHSY